MNIVSKPCHSSKYEERYANGFIKYIVLHSTEGTNSLGWLINPTWNNGGQVSVHYLIARDGTIYQMVPDLYRAWHAGEGVMPDGETDPNSYSIGIEIEHHSQIDTHYPEEQLQAVAELVRSLIDKYDIPGEYVVSHASIARPLGRKVDPWRFNWSNMWDRIFSLPGKPVRSIKQTPAVPAPTIKFTPQSVFTDYAIDNFLWDVVVRKVVPQDNELEVRLILSYYRTECLRAGLHPIMVVAQCLHETANLTSYWASQKNLAGLGVTGEPGKGLVFDSWETAVRAHVGHLLGYLYEDKDLTTEQQDLVRYSPRLHLIRWRGQVRTFEDLAGKWAVDTEYGTKLANKANSLVVL